MASTILPVSIALWSGYGLSLSYTAIQDVREYEEPTEQAAKYLNIAEDQLRHTRTTQGAGAGATLLSLVTSLALFGALYFPDYQPSPYIGIASSFVNGLACYAARVHIHNHWRNAKKVPLVGKYNEAIDKSNELRRALGWLALAWGAEGVGSGVKAVWG